VSGDIGGCSGRAGVVWVVTWRRWHRIGHGQQTSGGWDQRGRSYQEEEELAARSGGWDQRGRSY
jgi:hypothetical protein